MTNASIDISPLIQLAVSFLAIVMPAVAGYIAWVLKQKMDIQKGSAAATAVDAATSRAGGLAYTFLAQEASTLPHSINMRDAAVAQGVNHVIASTPDALKLLGVDNAAVTRMVSGELGKLEAVDTNVSVVKPAMLMATLGQTEPLLAPAIVPAVVPATPPGATS